MFTSGHHFGGRRLCVLMAGAVILNPSAAAPPEGRELITSVARRLLDTTGPGPAKDLVKVEFGGVGPVRPGSAGCYVSRAPGAGLPATVRVTTQLLADLRGDADALAFLVAREIGHVALGHLRGQKAESPLAFDRDQERTADQYGATLMLRAGFSFRAAGSGLARLLVPSPGDAPAAPSWDERAAHVRRQQAELGRAMSAFHSGVCFLVAGRPDLAEECFQRVVRECPGCTDAWLNLGAAGVELYWRQLDPADLPIAVPMLAGQTRRVGGPRGAAYAEKLWWRSVGALREALRLDPGSAAAKEYLALAYLLGPDNRDRPKAVELLEEIVNEPAPDPWAAAQSRLHLAAALLATGRRDEGVRQLDRAAEEAKALRPVEATTVVAALSAQRAAVLSEGDAASRLRAADLFEAYLDTVAPAALSWPGVAERYERLCRDLGRPAKSPDRLKQTAWDRRRQKPAVEIGPGQVVGVGDPADAVHSRVKPDRVVHALAGSNLRRLAFDRYDVELLVSDEVLLILLTGARAPALQFTTGGLRHGQTRDEVARLLAGAPTVRLRPAGAASFEFVHAWGIAMRFTSAGADGLVSEVVIGGTAKTP